MDTTRMMLAWVHMIDALNRSDFEPVAALLDEKCQWEGIGSSKDEIMTFFKSAKEQGWKCHHILSLAAEGDYLSSTARNESTDGSSSPVAGIIGFNSDGKITQMRSFAPVPEAA
jgi:SnoaL-like domain